MGLKSGLKEAAPFAAMVVVEWGEVGMVTLAKAALNTGISTFVYLVYYNSLGVVLLFPLFIFRTYRRGFLMFGYIGLKYSSPALAASLANLVPVFTFLIAIIFRMEKIDMRSPSSLAKALGTVVAVFGAFVVTLYKGPPIISGTFHSSLHSQALVPQNSNWALGGLLLTIGFFSAAIWIILQIAFNVRIPDLLLVDRE
ncbi:nodulin MtN21 /EamA-like transporter family protein [Actinidia rufa]|uniref:Nodulin MtN21 /EamA-like transporter family protein n=1 Tax=Actinidia rufa TaxID=165716 RepID=A0A7J0FW69_9ERIC|nr:nodulin MtN21 /EamA-like transporter family protein [Actinidia rufa]